MGTEETGFLRQYKRVVVLADLHCGHRIGLTPPAYHQRDLAASDKKEAKYFKAAIELWYEFENTINSLKPIDILLINGDAITGKEIRSGGTELIATDRNRQAEIAKECINFCEAGKILMTFGTPYHGGVAEDWEELVAEKVDAIEIKSQLFADINGVVFHLKHKVGASSIPHGKGTPLAKERLSNLLWAEHGEEPRVDVFIRSHVHYCFDVGEPEWRAIITPALQGKGSKYGSRICQGIVHFGLIHFDVYNNGEYYWKPHIARVDSQKAKVIKL
jgi:hypothetical protein